MKSRLAILFSFILVTALSSLSFAKDDEAAQPCKDEIKKFCKKEKGEENVNKCLQANSAKISVTCKSHIDEIAEYAELQKKVKNLRDVCKTDLETYCPAVTKGSGRQLKCLRMQADKLTPACKDTMAQAGVMDMPTSPMTGTAPQAPAVTAPANPAASTGTGTTAPAAPAAPAVPAPKK